ncbi:MAG TPA: hypothetical protein VG796_17850 [Verrucomicrobiales bacterium]|nr:hypothetical protein [Verrucomicrobiales bacterium]
MRILRYTALSVLLSSAAHADPANVDAYSRIYRHKDGSRTESFKNGGKNEITEFTYNQNNILIVKRTFATDSKGRHRMGYIFDGKLNPLGSVQFGYDSQTDQLVEERQFNRKGQLIRRLFYPGTVKSIKGLENRFVALNYDPDNPNAAPVQSKEAVAPTKPVEQDLDDFEPGRLIGASAPSPHEASSSSKTTAAAPATPAPRKRFWGRGNTAPAPSANPAPQTTPPANVTPPPPAAPAATPPAAKRTTPGRNPQT